VSEVKVHISAGCGLCGRKDAHTHPYSEWKDFIDTQTPDWMKEKK
jgi:hypothetical protein